MRINDRLCIVANDRLAMLCCCIGALPVRQLLGFFCRLEINPCFSFLFPFSFLLNRCEGRRKRKIELHKIFIEAYKHKQGELLCFQVKQHASYSHVIACNFTYKYIGLIDWQSNHGTS